MKKVKAYVIFYKEKISTSDRIIDLSNYKYFMNKQDLAKFLTQVDGNFVPLAIKYMDVSNTLILDKYFDIVENALKKGGK